MYLDSLNKAFKSDSQRLAVSLRSSIAKRRSHLNAALVCKGQKSIYGLKALFYVLAIHLFVFQSHELPGGTMLEVFAVNE